MRHTLWYGDRSMMIFLDPEMNTVINNKLFSPPEINFQPPPSPEEENLIELVEVVQNPEQENLIQLAEIIPNLYVFQDFIKK